ncbi:MAG: hypothetical protein H6584_07980 [Flavobacteriales bacterium]|nr:hypothetical protein [Flavobacteriales bacterium]
MSLKNHQPMGNIEKAIIDFIQKQVIVPQKKYLKTPTYPSAKQHLSAQFY